MPSLRATVYVASSLNGLMTRGDTDSDWVSPGDEEHFAKRCAEAGCVLVGRKTFEQYHGKVYPVPGAANIVLSKGRPRSPEPSVHYAAGLEQAIAEAQRLGFSRCIVAGGSSVIGQCLNAGIVDEVLLSLHPLLFSSGLPAFGAGAGDFKLGFSGIEKTAPDFLLLRYRVLTSQRL